MLGAYPTDATGGRAWKPAALSGTRKKPWHSIPNCSYAERTRAWGGSSYVASMVAEFRDALDSSPVGKKYIAPARKAGVGRKR